jgi:predicted ester cyclase
MSIEENKAVVRRYFDERWNHGNADVCDELLAPGSDIEGTKSFVRSFHTAFGNLTLAMPVLISEDNHVAVHWRITGTHHGEYAGIAPTGKRVTFQGLALLHLEDGKIVEDEAYGNFDAVVQELCAN